MKHIINLSLRLLMVCIAASAGLAAVYTFTAERIKQNEQYEFQEKLKQVIPGADRFEIKGDTYNGFAGDKKLGSAVTLTPNGYGGMITLLLGVDQSWNVSGIAVLSHKETPGLGKKIESAWFRNQFVGKGAQQVSLKRDSSDGMINAITAATISSRAVTRAIHEALSVEYDASATPKLLKQNKQGVKK